MIDVKELVRQGKVRRDDEGVKDFNTNKDGFVDMGHPSNKSGKKVVVSEKVETEGGFMNFMNVGDSGSSEDSGSLNSGDCYSKREVDVHIQKLDSMIYKLEQRIELLERKVGVSSPGGDSAIGTMGW